MQILPLSCLALFNNSTSFAFSEHDEVLNTSTALGHKMGEAGWVRWEKEKLKDQEGHKNYLQIWSKFGKVCQLILQQKETISATVL